MNSPDFATSNRMLFAVIKNLKQRGLDFTKHYSVISNADLDLILNERAFNMNNPKELQEKVFFDIMINFARRGRENLRNLTKSSFNFGIDDAGSRYCELNFNEKTKNHQTVEDHQSKPRMYANNTPTCPLKSLEMYMSKLNPECETLFTIPLTSKKFKAERETIWFTSRVLGINTLGNIMKNISKRLRLSQDYTNHCIRATCISLLASNGLEARQIMRVSGHKSESSLRSYDHDNSVEQKRKISAILSNSKNSATSSSSFTCPIFSALEPVLPPFNNRPNCPTVSATATLSASSQDLVSSSALPLPIDLHPVPVHTRSTTTNDVNSRFRSGIELSQTQTHANINSRNDASCSFNTGTLHPQHFVISNNTNCQFYFNTN